MMGNNQVYFLFNRLIHYFLKYVQCNHYFMNGFI